MLTLTAQRSVPPAEVPYSELPNKLWAWLEAGLEDLTVLRERPDCSVDMSYWMRVFPDATCSVCLAGAVMLRRAVLPEQEPCSTGVIEVTPSSVRLPLYAATRLSELNMLRCGHWPCAYQAPSKAMRQALHAVLDSPYDTVPWDEWLTNMRQILKLLKDDDI